MESLDQELLLHLLSWLEKEKANFLSNLVYIKSRLLHLKSQQELNFIDLDSDGSGVEHNTTS